MCVLPIVSVFYTSPVFTLLNITSSISFHRLSLRCLLGFVPLRAHGVSIVGSNSDDNAVISYQEGRRVGGDDVRDIYLDRSVPGSFVSSCVPLHSFLFPFLCLVLMCFGSRVSDYSSSLWACLHFSFSSAVVPLTLGISVCSPHLGPSRNISCATTSHWW